jgi:hypothetical protein
MMDLKTEGFMRRAKAVGLSPSEEIALRRIGFGIVRPGALKTSDVEHLTSLGLVWMRENALGLTPPGERLMADLPTGSLLAQSLKDDEHVAAVAKALGVKT